MKFFFTIFIIIFLVLFCLFNGLAFGDLVEYKASSFYNALSKEISTIAKLTHNPLNEEKTEKNDLENPKTKKEEILAYLSEEEIKNKENLQLLILPKFKIKAPIKKVDQFNESLIYQKLKEGVVLFPGTAEPGKGYSIIIGHSSQYPWQEGNYKSVFSLLNELSQEDEIYVLWQGKILIYQVEEKKIFLPFHKGGQTTEEIFPIENKPILILQSCWPAGVDQKRVAIKTLLASESDL